MQRRLHALSGMLALGLFAACGESSTGGVTASLVYSDAPTGTLQRALRPFAPPPEVDMLVITALDVDGSTLAQTVLSTTAMGAQELRREGGAWRLDNVPVGIDRTLVAAAFFGSRASDPSMRGRLAYRGVRRHIRVEPAVISNIGDLVLERVGGVRVARLDAEAPSPPTNLRIDPIAEGNALRVRFDAPTEPDLGGYVVAFTASTAAAPSLSRGASVRPDRALVRGSNIRISHVLDADDPRDVTIRNLPNRAIHRVYVYAFDRTFEGAPLNYSAPAIRDGTPIDTTPPGAVSAITITSSSSDVAVISFVSSGEDGAEGRVLAFEVRSATTRDQLMTASAFAMRRVIEPPAAVDPGQRVSFERTFEVLQARSTDAFVVGIRAIDASNNIGPIAIGDYTLPSTITPSLESMDPPIGFAGATLSLVGTLFGSETGTVTLSEDTTVSPTTVRIPTTSWDNNRITLTLPVMARSGRLTIARADGRGQTSTYLATLRPIDAEVGFAPPPFEILAAPRPNGDINVALYGARVIANTFDHAVQRIVALDNDDVRYAPFVTTSPITAIGAGYSPDINRFVFVASTATEPTMSAAIISSSTVAPNALRRQNAVPFTNADGVAVEVLRSGGQAVPTVVAFSAAGRVNVGFIGDIATMDFSTNGFTAVTASTARSEFVDMTRRAEGNGFQYLLAYREGGPLRGQLVIQSAAGTGSGPATFNRPVFTERPAMGERVRILDVPGVGFLLAYEERQLGGRTDIRLLRLNDYGIGTGLAPFGATSLSRRLEDVGLVERNGQPWIAVLVSTLEAGVRMSYAEIPVSAVVRDARMNIPMVSLGYEPQVPNEPLPGGRLACKPRSSRTCLITWLGQTAPSTVFVRQ